MTTETATTYNGWTNWETWNTALWIGNDEYMQEESVRIVREAVEESEPPFAELDDFGRAGVVYEAARALRDWYETLFDPSEMGNPAYPGPVQDAWNATIGATNWDEIAENIAGDLTD